MRSLKTWSLAGFGALAAAAALAQPGALRESGGENPAGFYRASEVIGTSVRGEGGQELGQIRDLLIDGNTQEVRYFILGSGETVDAQAQANLTVVPWSAARPNFEAADNRYVDLRIEQQRLRQAPTLTWQQIQAGPRADWATNVDRFYGVEGRRRGDGRPGRVEVERDGDVEIEGRGRPNARPDRPRGDVEIEGDDDGVRVRPGVRPEARPGQPVQPAQPGVRPRQPAGDVEVERDGNEVEIEGRVRPNRGGPNAGVRVEGEDGEARGRVTPGGQVEIQPDND